MVIGLNGSTIKPKRIIYENLKKNVADINICNTNWHSL